jgi:hypothetical protein
MAGALAYKPFLFAERQVLFGVTSIAIFLTFLIRLTCQVLPWSDLFIRQRMSLSLFWDWVYSDHGSHAIYKYFARFTYGLNRILFTLRVHLPYSGSGHKPLSSQGKPTK